MRLSFLRLIAIAVALALPLQGWAAITAHCAALDLQQAGGGQDHAHDHHDLGHDDSSADGHEAGKGVHCGPSTAYIAGTSLLPLLSAPHHAAYFFSQFPPLAVQPDGVYRPPLAL